MQLRLLVLFLFLFFCLRWHIKEKEMTPKQVRLELSRLQISAATPPLFP